MNSCFKAVLIVCGIIVAAFLVCGAVGGIIYGIVVGVMRANAGSAGTACPRSGGSCTPGTSIDFSTGFQQCCPSTANELNLGQAWTESCLNLVGSFKTAYDTSKYEMILLGLGMQGAEYTNALFWSTNRVNTISSIATSISSNSPPSSFNIPAGAFGNCISKQYTSVEFNDRFVQYWLLYSQLMAERATGYVFWLTSGDSTTRYFPDVEMGMMERIWGMRELPNLRSALIPGVVVLNARSAGSTGLTCISDTQSKDKLVSINSRLVYVCCDVPLTQSAVLASINNVRQGKFLA